MDWYIYIIFTNKKKLYTGISTEPERRFVEHLCDRKKGAKFFRSDSPDYIIYLEEADSMSLALKREIAIKRMSTKQKWTLIQVYQNSLKLIQD